MTADPCFDVYELADLAAGAFDERLRGRIETHLAACSLCRRKAAQAWGEVATMKGTPRLPGMRFRFFPLAAAASFLAAVGGMLFYRAHPSVHSTRADPLPLVQGVSDELRAGAGENRCRLPDGTLLVLQEGTFVRFHPPAQGERTRLELVQGTLEVQAAPGKGLFRVLAPSGEIRVIGTRFRARTLRLVRSGTPADSVSSRPRIVEGFCVDLYEGKVFLLNSLGETTIAAPSRGVVLADQEPVPLERGGSPREVLAKFNPRVEKEAEFLAALFWGADWGGPSLEVLRPALTGRERESLEFLERMATR